MSLNSYFEAFDKPSLHMLEKTENPQVYDSLVSTVEHIKPKRHILGLVGGDEVYTINGDKTDLESDLRGITRPNTWGTQRKHLPIQESVSNLTGFSLVSEQSLSKQAVGYRRNQVIQDQQNGDVITRTNPKNSITIQATPQPRKEFQLWAYPAVSAPLPFKVEACKHPEKF